MTKPLADRLRAHGEDAAWQVLMVRLSRAELAEILAALAKVAGMEGRREWLVWSNEHRSWWAADRCGYRGDARDAGRYTLTEARSICGVRSMEIVPPETMIHEKEALRGSYMNIGDRK